ncbi:MAG: HEAT repeat domain-containing protein [Caldilineaceae bacterium]|nr:HEAT repeat domain-containing protein [Caldilineaceae bacterium]
MAISATYRAWLAAIDAGDDEQAEALSRQLTLTDSPALLAQVAAADLDLRWWAVRALALYGPPAAAGPIAAACDDPEPSVRAAAALALSLLCGRYPAAAEPYLSALAVRLADIDGMVRQANADALAQCGEAALPVLAEVLEFGPEAARARGLCPAQDGQQTGGGAALPPAQRPQPVDPYLCL